MAASSVRKRSFVKDSRSPGGGALLGYARVSKGDEQNNSCRPRRSEPPAAAASLRKPPRAGAGTGPSCTACWITCAKGILSSSGSSTACRGR